MKSRGRTTMFKRPCKAPMCSQFSEVGSQYCSKHKLLVNQERPNSYQRGYNSRWRKERKLFIERNPMCKICLEDGRVTMATVVDHIKPHKGDQRLFWDQNNWQALCETCHNRKTRTDDMGAWIP